MELLEKLQHITESLPVFLPEIWLAALSLLVLLADLLKGHDFHRLPSLVLAGGLLLFLWLCTVVPVPHEQSWFLHMLFSSKTGSFLRLFFGVCGLLAISLVWFQAGKQKKMAWLRGEYSFIICIVLLGLCLLVQSRHLLMIYLSLEVVSIGSYILTLFRLNKKAAAGAIKYLLFGAVSSGIMLYGMSLLWVFTGSLYLPQVASGLQSIPEAPAAAALVLLSAGLVFKLAAFPFQFWVPDVYEAAPTPVVAFFSVAPKAGGLLVIYNLLLVLPDGTPGKPVLVALLAAVAIATIFWGNLSALRQQNVKRMLADSSIAHAGFLLTGVLALPAGPGSALLFYLSIYALMNFAAFAFVQYFARGNQSFSLEKTGGFGLQYPFAGVLVLVVMVSLTGLPVTAGFSAKLFIFSALWKTWQIQGGPLLLVLFAAGLFNSVISLFYYLRLPWFMFFKPARQPLQAPGYPAVLFLSVLALPLLLFFFRPDWLLGFIGNFI